MNSEFKSMALGWFQRRVPHNYLVFICLNVLCLIVHKTTKNICITVSPEYKRQPQPSHYQAFSTKRNETKLTKLTKRNETDEKKLVSCNRRNETDETKLTKLVSCNRRNWQNWVTLIDESDETKLMWRQRLEFRILRRWPNADSVTSIVDVSTSRCNVKMNTHNILMLF